MQRKAGAGGGDRLSIPHPPACASGMLFAVVLSPCLGCRRSLPWAAAFNNNSLEMKLEAFVPVHFSPSTG